MFGKPNKNAEVPEGMYNLVQTPGNKQTVQFKLTDSALKAIEAYLNSGVTDEIQCGLSDNNQGTLIIPTLDKPQKFTFHSAVNKISLECYKQDTKSGNILNMGAVKRKLTVRGNDDSYSNTRVKMVMAMQQEQKSTTKVLKSVGKSSKTSTRCAETRITQRVAAAVKTVSVSPAAAVKRTAVSRSADPKNKKTKKSLPSTENSQLSGTKLGYQEEQSSSQAKHAAVDQRLLMDATIHILAASTVSFANLKLRLKRFFGEPDSVQLRKVLDQVASCIRKNSRPVYQLKSNFFSQLDPNWPNFTADERIAVKEIILKQTLIKPSAEKRSSTDEETIDYSNPKKKKRVSLHQFQYTGSSSSQDEKPKASSCDSPKSSHANDFRKNSPPKPTSPLLPPPKATAQQTFLKPSCKQTDPTLKSHPMPDNVSSNGDNLQSKSSEAETPLSMEKSQIGVGKRSSNKDENRKESKNKEPLCTDYLTEYVTVTSRAQRDKYYDQFYKLYNIYLQLHTKVNETSTRFKEYKKQYKLQRSNPRFSEELKKTVMRDYQKLKYDKEFNDSQKRVKYLHRKLQHIKGLVHEFDNKKS